MCTYFKHKIQRDISIIKEDRESLKRGREATFNMKSQIVHRLLFFLSKTRFQQKSGTMVVSGGWSQNIKGVEEHNEVALRLFSSK